MTIEEQRILGHKLVLSGLSGGDVTLTGQEARRLVALLELIALTYPIDPDTMAGKWLNAVLDRT